MSKSIKSLGEPNNNNNFWLSLHLNAISNAISNLTIYLIIRFNKFKFHMQKMSALKDTVKWAEDIIVDLHWRWFHPPRPRPLRDH